MRYSVFILLLVTGSVFGQETHCRWISDFGVALELEENSLVPGSFSLSSPADIHLDLDQNLLMVVPKSKTDSIEVCYSIFPFRLGKVYQPVKPPVDGTDQATPQLTGNEIAEDPPGNDLIKSGIISRGVNMGNQQDMSVDSRMDLDLEGKLTENLNLRARIFDQNIPYQPEGNTNSLKNFDRLNITVFSDRFALEAGDIYLNQNSYSYLRYNRGLMGAGISLSDSSQQVDFRTGVNKGKFHSFSFSGEEGMNGPYPVRGPVSDPFVIILAASERIYMDGRLLERGVHYRIDYNLGEITFLPSVIVGRYSRFRIDFEYMNRGFQRSAQAINYEFNKGGTRVYLGYFREQDDPFRASGVSEADLEKLSATDDHQIEVFTPERIEYDPEQTSYIITDSLGHSGILQYSRDPALNHYKVEFSYVGPGNGNYIRDHRQVNRVVYKWVNPENGDPAGTYEPIRKLNSPVRKQVVNLGIETLLNKHDLVYSEIGIAGYKSNILSDAGNQGGIALKSGIRSRGRTLKRIPDMQVMGGLELEWIGKDYKGIDPFRSVDFERDWGMGYSDNAEPANELFINTELGLWSDTLGGIKWNGGIRHRGVEGSAWRSELQLSRINSRINMDAYNYEMRGDLAGVETNWSKYLADISVPLGMFRPGYVHRAEHHKAFGLGPGTRLSSLQYFDEHKWYLNSSMEAASKFQFSYSIREDKVPINGDLRSAGTARTFGGNWSRAMKTGHLQGQVSHRVLSDSSTAIRSFMGGVSGNIEFLKGAVLTRFNSSTSNAWEPKREFIYLQVPNGQGFYAWRDLNDDGEQQVDEFFEALNPDERNYIRYFVNTSERIPSFENRASMDMKFNWPRKGPFGSRLSSTLSVETTGKVLEADISSRLSSISNSLDRDEVLSGRRRARFRIMFRDLFELIDAEGGYRTFEQKNWVMDGSEFREEKRADAKISIDIGAAVQYELKWENESRRNGSDVLMGRDYSFIRRIYGNKITWTSGQDISMKLQYDYKSGRGTTGDRPIESGMHLSSIDLDRRISKDFSLKARTEWAVIRYDGDPSTAMAYDLMEAFQPGHNFRWNLNVQRQLLSGLLLDVIYFGRSSPEQKVVHRASLRLSARF